VTEVAVMVSREAKETGETSVITETTFVALTETTPVVKVAV